MNILMLVDDLNIGGTATHILSISKALKERDFNLLIVSSFGELEKKFEENNLKVIYIDFYENLDNVCNNLSTVINLYNIDLLHAHLPMSIKICNKLKKEKNINYVVTLHGLFYDENVVRLCENSKHIICVSYPIKEILLKNLNNINDYKISVIYNGLKPFESFNSNIRENLKINKDYKIITYCSRLNNTKGYLAEKFLYEFYNIAKSRDDVFAIVLGDGPRKRAIDFYANSINLKLNKNVILVKGNVLNPFEYFLESKCVVGTARVIIEALNSNVGCVALGSKGFAGLIQPNSYKDMLDTYFGEHKFIDNPKYNLKESIEFILNNNLSLETIKSNKIWCNKMFNEDLLISMLVNIYNK